jgi:hypothetical protein
MTHLRIIWYTGILVALFSSTQLLLPPNEVPYPEGFRNWKHVKTAIIGPQSPAFAHWGGFHHIYANDKAVEGYKSNHFPNGSILVFDVLEAIQKDSDFGEGKRRKIDVMVKDSVLFAGTGGWGAMLLLPLGKQSQRFRFQQNEGLSSIELAPQPLIPFRRHLYNILFTFNDNNATSPSSRRTSTRTRGPIVRNRL